MIVIILTDCPPKLRGDLSKWMIEINTGVYVGNLNSRVRDALWARVCENLRNGRATMVYSAGGEQHMDFRVHNTSWTPVDFDGLKLMRKPSPLALADNKTAFLSEGFSKAGKYRKLRAMNAARAAARSQGRQDEYIVADVETTGLAPGRDEIVEIAALHIRNGKVISEFSKLVSIAGALPDTITQLTGITQKEIELNGQPLKHVMREFLDFLGEYRLVCYNARFDQAFIQLACNACDLPNPANACVDVVPLAKRKLKAVENYKLNTLARYFSLPEQSHRALSDCELTSQVYEKLMQIEP